MCIYIYSCVYRASNVGQVSTKLKRDTKFRKTFRFPLIFLPECLLFDASRRSLCHGLPRILGPVQIPRKMVLHLQSTPFQYPFSHVLSDFQTSIRVLSTQPTSSEHNRSEIEIVGLGFRHIYEPSSLRDFLTIEQPLYRALNLLITACHKSFPFPSL